MKWLTDMRFCSSGASTGTSDRDFIILLWILGIAAVAGGIALIILLCVKLQRKKTAPAPAAVAPVYDMPVLQEYFGLTVRETDVLEQMLGGKDDVVIAKTLGVSLSTVHGHVRNIYKKSDARSFKELAGICRMCQKN